MSRMTLFFRVVLWGVFSGIISMSLVTKAWPAERFVIIHADDSGLCHSVNRATIEAMEQGLVSSASIMVPCPWFPEFARYAAAHPEKDFGIHLTLNAEWDTYRWRPVAPSELVPSLVDEQGFLWDNVDQVVANVKAEEAEIELRAQIERARSFGIQISHFDPHMGAALSRPDLAKVYVKLALEYDTPVLFVQPTEQNGIAKQYPDTVRMVPALQEKNLPILTELYQFYDRRPFEERKATYLNTLRNLPTGVSEIIIHCGFDDLELRAVTDSYPTRDSDRRIFTDADVKAEIEKLGIQVITWRDFREMTRRRP